MNLLEAISTIPTEILNNNTKERLAEIANTLSTMIKTSIQHDQQKPINQQIEPSERQNYRLDSVNQSDNQSFSDQNNPIVRSSRRTDYSNRQIINSNQQIENSYRRQNLLIRRTDSNQRFDSNRRTDSNRRSDSNRQTNSNQRTDSNRRSDSNRRTNSN